MGNAMLNPDQIRKARKRLNLTQAELAEKIGLSRNAIAQWETGRCSPRGPAEILIRQMLAAIARTPVRS